MPEKGKRWKKRVHYKSPSGESRQRYKEKKASALDCGNCGKRLHGVPHGKKKAALSRMSKTEKKPSVPFGGVLCSPCRRNILQEAVLSLDGEKSLKETSLNEKKWIEIAIATMKR